MNRSCVFTVLFLLGSTAFSQTLSTSPERGSSCPLELQAKMEFGTGHLAPVSEKAPVDSKTLQVKLTNSRSSSIVRTKITILGFPVGARVEPAVLYPNGENPSAVAKIFTLERTIEPGQSSSFDVSAPEFSAIARIDLDSVDYADKSNWNHTGQKACQAELQAGEAAGRK